MSDGTHTHISKEEYEGLVQKLAADGDRTPRQREVEACYSKPLPAVLAELSEECGSKAEMLRRINSALDANGNQQSVSRGTLYNWLDEYGN